MKTESHNLFDGLKELIKEAVREELEQALSKKADKPKLLLPPAEAAEMLSVPKTWLEARAREGSIPSVKCGHYRLFGVEDLKAFIENQKTKKNTEDH
jgi:excisionase family DNA binding protein